MRALNSHFNKDEYAKAFGIEVNPEMEKVEARILPPPTLEYRSGISITPLD